MNIALPAYAEGFSDYLRGRLLADEHNSRVTNQRAYAFSRFKPMQIRQPDIQQNQVRLKGDSLLDGFQAVRSLS